MAIITISRGSFSKGKEVAEKVAKILGYQCISREILLEAKILAVADVVEAMAFHRPYRAALGIDKALTEIMKGKGRSYEPKAVNACLDLFKRNHYRFESDSESPGKGISELTC